MINAAPNLNVFDNSDRLETDTGRGKTKKRGNFRTIKSILFLQYIIRPVTIRHQLLKIKNIAGDVARKYLAKMHFAGVLENKCVSSY